MVQYTVHPLTKLSHQCLPWDLCVAGNLGSMESNVMAGRALLGCLQLPDGQRRRAIFLVHEKVTQGSSKSAEIELIGGLLLSR